MRISFFGHFGTYNSGNESTLVAILSRLRFFGPDWDFSCICSNPESVTASYGVEATSISSRTVRIRRRGLAGAFSGLSKELWQYARAFRTLKGTDVFVVAGTGLLTDAYGLSGWGPYNIFKWTLMAKLRRCTVLFVSVGAGPIDSALGRLLVRAALSLADYRSYRDDASLSYLNQIGLRVRQDRVYPDLAFSLPDALLQSNGSSNGRNRVVALGLMLYSSRYSASDPSRKTYTTYLEALAVFVAWLLANDYDVRLFLGDGDTVVIQEFQSLLGQRLGVYDEVRVLCQQNTSVGEPLVAETLSQIAASDVVVATRFHNVLLSLLLEKPVIALSFHSKCESLMNGFGLSEYVHDIHHIDAVKLIEQFQQLETNTTEVKQLVSQRIAECRSELDEQYCLLLEMIGATDRVDAALLQRPQPQTARAAYEVELVVNSLQARTTESASDGSQGELDRLPFV